MIVKLIFYSHSIKLEDRVAYSEVATHEETWKLGCLFACLSVCLSVRQFRLFACRLSCKQSWSKINWSILNEKKSSLLQAISVIYSLMSFYLQSEIALSLWTTIASTHFFLIVKGLNTVHKVVPGFYDK